MWIFAALGLALGAVGAITNYSNNKKASSLQQDQLELQRQQAELQKESYYDSLTDKYYQYLDNVNTMQSQLDSAQNASNQTNEDIASNEYFLTRWQSNYDASIKNSVNESFNTYAKQASSIGAANVAKAESGNLGGSKTVVSDIQKRQMLSLVGDSLQFNLSNDTLLGLNVNTTAQDLLAERQTALTAVRTGYRSLDTYKETMSTLKDSIGNMNNTALDLKKKLKGYGRQI